jgi:hypothetical protein
MYNPIEQMKIFVQKTLPEVFDDSLSYYEAVARLMAKVNETIKGTNDLNDDLKMNVKELKADIAKKEYSDDITVKRKLSPLGDFSGTLLGRTIIAVFSDISNALSLCQTLIQMVNDRESIGTIYDGGNFVDTDPPTFSIEGGVF